jgi:hypothetical protein
MPDSMYTFFSICGAMILTSVAVVAAGMTAWELWDRYKTWLDRKIKVAFDNGQQQARETSGDIVRSVARQLSGKDQEFLSEIAICIKSGLYVRSGTIESWKDQGSK